MPAPRYSRLCGLLLFLGLALSAPSGIAAPHANNAPQAPFLLGPPNEGVNVPLSTLLEWWTFDPDADELRFDVYFGAAPTLNLVAANIAATTFNPGPLAYNTLYNWYVVARDTHGATTQGPTWTFTTRPQNFAPVEPYGPSPTDNATIQPISLTLSWDSFDNDGEPVTFDVYIGSTNPPPLVANNITARSHSVSGLSYDTVYFWKIVARDPHGAETTGPTWKFTTRLANYPPTAPASPSPLNNATNVSMNNQTRFLFWQSSDADGDVLTYDVYFGTVSPPPLVASNQPEDPYLATNLAFVTTYYWRIVVRDDDGVEVSGPQWTFTTEASDPPNTPSNPSPANNATNRPLQVSLGWFCSDPDAGQVLSYDLYFGTSPSPPLVATGLTTRNWSTPPLTMGTDYYWQVVARDPLGLTTNGPVWKFTTLINLPPTVPSNPSPADGAQLAGHSTTLSWTSTDPESKPMSYQVYFGTSPTPGLFTTVMTPQVSTGGLGANLQFYWYIIASDGVFSTTGPVWSFRTGPGNGPPTAPANPSPAHNATNVSTSLTLSWESADPDGDPLTYRLYFGTTIPPPHVNSNVQTNSYPLSELTLSTDYYWQISSRDTHGHEVSGSIWKFTTAADDGPPSIGSWSPADDATNVAPTVTLLWQTDHEGMVYDIYFGTAENPPLILIGKTTPFYTPAPLSPGTEYHWRVVARDELGTVATGPPLSFTTAGTLSGASGPPLELSLGLAYPNPFNPQTRVPYGIPKAAHVRATIYDAAGRHVRRLVDAHQSAGWREVVWRGENDNGGVAPSGIYYCVLQVGNERRTQKLVLLK